MSKKTNTHNAQARLDAPLHRNSAEELVQINRQQMDRIKLAVDYPNQPGVQAAVTALSASTDALDKRLSAIEAKRAELATLLQGRGADDASVARDREALRVAINVVAKGSADAIRAWNCFVVSKQQGPVSQLAPVHLTMKNSPTTPGTVTAKCKGVANAGGYLFVFTIDPNAAPGVGQMVSSTRAECELTGQAVGHVLYARVAVTRRGGSGQSVWSDPAQLLVR
jgi:hypothetical protein